MDRPHTPEFSHLEAVLHRHRKCTKSFGLRSVKPDSWLWVRMTRASFTRLERFDSGSEEDQDCFCNPRIKGRIEQRFLLHTLGRYHCSPRRP
jgi:hypothetical protein